MIKVSSVVPTIKLLDESLQDAVQAVLCSTPLFHFPTRLSCWYAHMFASVTANKLNLSLLDREGKTSENTTAYIEIPLRLDLRKSFTILVWTRRFGNDVTRCFLSVESPHSACSLLWLGRVQKEARMTCKIATDLGNSDRTTLKTGTSVGSSWVHVAMVQRWNESGTPDEWSVFVNGHKEASIPISMPMPNADQVRSRSTLSLCFEVSILRMC